MKVWQRGLVGIGLIAAMAISLSAYSTSKRLATLEQVVHDVAMYQARQQLTLLKHIDAQDLASAKDQSEAIIQSLDSVLKNLTLSDARTASDEELLSDVRRIAWQRHNSGSYPSP
jgi:phage-related tail protein